MRTAIFSDLHDLIKGLHAVETDAQHRGADRLLYLGDVGHRVDLFQALLEREITCVFGNWEVSGLRRLPQQLAAWVASWPVAVDQGLVRYCHATPDLPASVQTTADARLAVAHGPGWRDLFPRLHLNETARWSALAALETLNLRAAFHGHTHIQQAWSYRGGRWHTTYGPGELCLDPGTEDHPARYLIGVGSAGDPQDGRRLRYALYDDADRSVNLLELETTPW
jgi:predicted phosphodiesterase